MKQSASSTSSLPVVLSSAVSYMCFLLLDFGGVSVWGYARAKKKSNQAKQPNEVTSVGTDGSDLAFRDGDSYRVLYSDTDMVLIEKVGDANNPYMVSPDFLRTVSNYE